MDIKTIDTNVFLNKYVDVWHPKKDIRLQARTKLKRILAGVHIINIEKLIDWMKIPCLFHMKDMCHAYLKSTVENPDPANVENIIQHSKETVSYLGWINDQLGVDERVLEPDYNNLRQKAMNKVNSGTLLAYS